MKTGSWKRSHILLASFLLPAGVMTAALALGSVVPFGSRSLGVLDMANQYLDFLSSLRDVLAGRASALYLPSLALGGNMTGLFAYYLMSPLDLVTCLFPRERLLTAVTALYILRVGLCGLTMAVYCGSRRGWKARVLLPAAAYALMGYMTAYSINYQWHDSLILLPLVALGIARLAEGRGRWLYILSLAAALAVNFYIGYMLCIFSVLWFVFELLTGQGSRPRQAIVRFALGSLAAGALAAAVLIPAFLSLQGGKAGLASAGLDLSWKFSPRAMLVKLFPGAFDYNELTPDGLPNIFTGTVTAALAALYLANGSIPRRRRLGGALLAAFLALSFCLPILDLVWHGMNVPTWYNFRYSFLFSFLLAAGADAALARLREGTVPWHLLLPVCLTALCAALAFAGRSYEFITWRAAAWSLAVTALACGGLWLLLRPGTSPRTIAAAGALLLLLHIADLGLNAWLSLDGLTVTCTDPAAWEDYIAEKAPAFDLIDTGGEYIRVESPEMFAQDHPEQNRCEPMLFGYDGLSHFSSNIPVKNLDFLHRLGLARFNDVFILYGTDVPAGSDSLLGVRYLVTDRAVTKPYEPVAASGRWTVYENPWALPLGWTADAAFAGALDGPDCFSYVQALYAAAAPEVGQAVYTPAQVTDMALEGLSDEGGTYTPTDRSGSLAYTLSVRAGGPLYAMLDIPGDPGAPVFVDGRFLSLYANGQNNGALCLGEYEAGDTVTVQLTVMTPLTVRAAAFATENADALAAYHDAIASGGCPLTKLSASHFTGSFTTGDGDSLLVLTVPYDSGWRIMLDGTRTEAMQAQDCLTAIPVTAGTHTLEMRYVPPGLVIGCCVSAAAAAVCLAVWLLSRRKKLTHP